MWFWPLNRPNSADQKVNGTRALKHNGCIMQFNGTILGPMLCNLRLRCLNWALLHCFFFFSPSLRLLRTRGLLLCRLMINMLEIRCWCKIRKVAQWPFVGIDAQLCDCANFWMCATVEKIKNTTATLCSVGYFRLNGFGVRSTARRKLSTHTLTLTTIKNYNVWRLSRMFLSSRQANI